MEILNSISVSLTLFDIAKTIALIILFIVAYIIIFYRSFNVLGRLGKNLGGKVFIYCPSGGKREDGTNKDMERELTVLKNSGYFNLKNEIVKDFNSIDLSDIKKSTVVVLGYHREMPNFNRFIEMVKSAEKPLIIYTFDLGYRLDLKHEEKIKDYKWYALSSMPLRLVSDLFAIMASYKHE